MKYEVHDIEWDDELVRRFWDNSTGQKDAKYFAFSRGRDALRTFRRFEKIEEKAILDFGGGPAHIFNWLCKFAKAFQYSVLDFSGQSLEEATKRHSGYANFEQTYLVNGYPIEIERQFDIVFIFEVIEHLDDRNLEAAISEVFKLLKPGGVVYVTTPNEEDLDGRKSTCPSCGCRFHQVQHVRSWDVGSVQCAFEDKGFETVTVGTTNSAKTGSSETWTFLVKNLLSALRLRKSKNNNLYYVGRKPVALPLQTRN